MRYMICTFAQANFNGHEATRRYLQLLPKKEGNLILNFAESLQSYTKLICRIFTILGETESFPPKSDHGTPGRRWNFNSCFGKSRCEYSSVKCDNGAKLIVDL
ncbi:hypothetical protein NQ318_007835 [Aromia moschata]|uniref:Uncharacterized protein n=1 Tax=Aromia moschata TaxID=1265417 RepID=A0AAV8Z231_9CUCU|nr:hypothetical protein NQ318_007835 [Aromia moschata]